MHFKGISNKRENKYLATKPKKYKTSKKNQTLPNKIIMTKRN